MRKIITALVALVALLATAAPAQEWKDTDVEKLVKEAPGKEAYPDASAVFLAIQKTTEVGTDRSVTTSLSSLLKVLTLQGREAYSNRSFVYDRDMEELSLLKGVTVRESGRVVPVEGDAVNDITPAFLAGATIYANVLEKVVSFPVAGAGSTMQLELREIRKPEKDGSFSGIEYLGANDPIVETGFTLRYPESLATPTNVAWSGAVGQVTLDKRSKRGELAFTIKNVPALVPEENMPPATELYPRAIYSSYQGWNEPAAFFAGEFFPHVQTDGDVAAKAQSLAAGLPTGEEKLRALFLDVATNVRNVYLDLGLGGYEPNDANTVLTNKYADTRDKAVLLVSMLRAAGFQAYPAAVRSDRGAFEASVPTLKQFDRVLVAVPEKSGYRFFDPFLDNVGYGYLRYGRGNTALVVKDDGTGELVTIPPFDPKENLSRKSLKIDIAADGSAQISTECELAGYFDRKARASLKDATPDEEKKAFDEAASAVCPGSASVDYSHTDFKDLTAGVEVRQRIKAPDFAVPQGDMMIVRVPAFPYEFAATGVAPSLAERKLPFVFPCETTGEFRVMLIMPKGYDVERIPAPASISTDLADFTLTCDWAPETRTITWKQTATVKVKTIPVERYGEFKAAYDAMAAPKNSLVLLKKTA
jgi:hypothetical protein